MRQTWQHFREAITNGFRHFLANDPLRMAGATAFFTSFALPPIIMLLVQTIGVFADRRSVGRQFGQLLRELLGESGARTVRDTIRHIRSLQHNLLITVALSLFLLFVATTLFNVIKNSIDQLWRMRMPKRNRFRTVVSERIVASGMILFGGLIFLAVQLVEFGTHQLNDYFKASFPVTIFYIGAVLNQILVVLLSGIWFLLLFRYLPSARPSWRVAIWGGLFTSTLFNCGKQLLRILLEPTQVNAIYGASGTLVVLLLFVFYSSMILYLGASFTQALGIATNRPLRPKAGARPYRIDVIEEKEEDDTAAPAGGDPPKMTSPVEMSS
jgi:membrane protein